MTSELIETVEGRVATFTMNRPERRNALTGTMLESMLEGFARVAADDDIGVVILTGAEGAFCAGGDVKAMAEGSEFSETGLEAKAAGLRRVMETSRLLHEMPKPTIAVVPGAAAGAGLSLALACDMRIAGRSAKFATAFARVGYSGDFGGSYYLTSLVGTAKARELYFTAELLDAETAAGLGMVNRLVEDGELESAARELAGQLADGPSIAYRYMKRNLNAAEHASLGEVLDLEAWGHTRCGGTEDHKEAAAAFVAKRAPVFKGR
jgi:2-(1,2-epoxy-1,2-dihydrophenyl)acetyl-CoA isomerase